MNDNNNAAVPKINMYMKTLNDNLFQKGQDLSKLGLNGTCGGNSLFFKRLWCSTLWNLPSSRKQTSTVKPIIIHIKSFQVLALSRTYIEKIMGRIIAIAQKILDHLNFSFIPLNLALFG